MDYTDYNQISLIDIAPIVISSLYLEFSKSVYNCIFMSRDSAMAVYEAFYEAENDLKRNLGENNSK